MMQRSWNIPDFEDEDQTVSGRQSPTLVSLHFIRSALRRRWPVVVLSPILGLLAAAAFLLTFPPSHDAKASLVLAHDPQVEPTRAMATDVSLLRTRTVAAETVASLGLAMTPEDFLKSVRAEPVSSELLTLTLGASTDAEAVRRLNVFTAIYLNFRGEQLSMQSNVLVDGIQQRITKLEAEVTSLSRRIEELSGAGGSSASKLSDTIAQRAYVQGRIEQLQQSIEDVMLQSSAVVGASRVIDPPAPETGGVKRHIVLVLASGMIGGAALGCGAVLFFAILSDRLRQRSDIASALEVPVSVSVGRITPLPKRWLWLPHLRTIDSRRSEQRERLAHAIEMELPVPGHRGRLAVACIDNADEVRFALVGAVVDLAAHGRSVAVVDLTQRGSLVGDASSIASADGSTALLRPRGIPSLASGPAELLTVGHEDSSPPSLEQYDITLVLADLDPSVGADYLPAWTDRVFVVVTAGNSSAERVRTAAELIRTAGLDLQLAAVVRTERTDDTFSAGPVRPAAVELEDEHDQPRLDFEEPIDESELLTADATSDAAILAEPLTETDESLLAGDEEVSEVDHAADEEVVEPQAAEEQEETREELVAAEEPVAFDEQEETPEEQEAAELQQIAEEELAVEEQHANAEQLVAEEPVAFDEQEETSEEQEVAELQQIAEGLAVDEQAATEEQHDETRELAPIEQLSHLAEEHDDTQELEAVEQQEQQYEASGENDDTQEMVAIEEQRVAPEEQPATEEQPVAVEPVLQAAELALQGENGHAAEPLHVTHPGQYEETVDGWDLYIVTYPPTNGDYTPHFEDDGFDWSWDWDLDDLSLRSDTSVSDAAEDQEGESTTRAEAEEDAQRESEEQADDRPRGFARVRTRTRSRSRRRSSRHR